MKISIIIPVFNEEDSLPHLYREIDEVLREHRLDAEIVFIDDGSSDQSPQILRQLAEQDERCRYLGFSRNFGQTAAMVAGIEHAKGEVIVPMDADLQNDPADIPRLLAKLDEGFDVVSGWRKNRRDKLFTRRLPSLIANLVISFWTGVKLHDFGCTLKAYRSRVLKGTALYGEMHRFVPVYAYWLGGRVSEIVVNHRARRFGTSKYGITRSIKVTLDLATLKLLGSYSTKPIYLFGGLGGLALFLGFLVFAWVVISKIFWPEWPHKMSLLLLCSLLITMGVLMIMMGLLAELIVRTYHESQNKPIYILDDRDKAPTGKSKEPSEGGVATEPPQGHSQSPKRSSSSPLLPGSDASTPRIEPPLAVESREKPRDTDQQVELSPTLKSEQEEC